MYAASQLSPTQDFTFKRMNVFFFFCPTDSHCAWALQVVFKELRVLSSVLRKRAM